MRVKLVQIDGKLPNLALMRLASWHKSRNDAVTFTRDTHHDLRFTVSGSLTSIFSDNGREQRLVAQVDIVH